MSGHRRLEWPEAGREGRITLRGGVEMNDYSGKEVSSR